MISRREVDSNRYSNFAVSIWGTIYFQNELLNYSNLTEEEYFSSVRNTKRWSFGFGISLYKICTGIWVIGIELQLWLIPCGIMQSKSQYLDEFSFQDIYSQL
jgi:hypothetical protein